MAVIRNATLIILIATLLGACSSSATTNLSVIVLIEDSDSNSIRAGTSVTNRVSGAIAEQLNQAGYFVYSPTVVSDGLYGTSFGLRRNASELLDMVRDAIRFSNLAGSNLPGYNLPIDVDVVATVSINPVGTKPGGGVTDIKVGITISATNVNSGQLLGNYELIDAVESIRINNNCADGCVTDGGRIRSICWDGLTSGVCMRDRVGSHARDIGQQVGNEIARLIRGNADNK